MDVPPVEHRLSINEVDAVFGDVGAALILVPFKIHVARLELYCSYTPLFRQRKCLRRALSTPRGVGWWLPEAGGRLTQQLVLAARV